MLCEWCNSPNHQTFDCTKAVKGQEPPFKRKPEPKPVAVEVRLERELEPVFWKERWLNGPKICSARNLPAFGTLKEMEQFHKRNGGEGRTVTRQGKCSACGCWHYESRFSDIPSDTLPKNFAPHFTKATLELHRWHNSYREEYYDKAHVEMPERPKEEIERAVEQAKAAPKPRRDVGLLF